LINTNPTKNLGENSGGRVSSFCSTSGTLLLSNLSIYKVMALRSLYIKYFPTRLSIPKWLKYWFSFYLLVIGSSMFSEASVLSPSTLTRCGLLQHQQRPNSPTSYYIRFLLSTVTCLYIRSLSFVLLNDTTNKIFV
jgi:hypothetical protein